MKWWEAVMLGLVQGATEFLPVSSSGHLILLEKLGVGSQNMFFNIMLHVATLAAVLIALRRQWIPLLRHPLQKTNLFILVACVPTVALALIFDKLLPGLANGDFLATGFMLTAVLLFASETLLIAKPKVNNIKISVLTGFMQGVAVLPGVSRSGSTIAAMRLCGMSREEAAPFSFLLSIPVIIGSAVYESAALASASGSGFVSGSAAEISFGGIGIAPLLLGMVCAFGSGLAAVVLFLKLIKKRGLTGFAVYDGLLAVVTLVLLGVGVL